MSTLSRADVEAEFGRFLNHMGFYPKTVVASGKPERFSITYPNGKRKNNGSYTLYADGRPNGFVFDWSRSEFCFKWTPESKGEKLSQAEYKRLRDDQDRAARQRQKEKADASRAATAAAAAYWDAAQPADPMHGYLSRKRIAPHTARIGADGLGKDALLIPMHDRDGAIVSITRIWADGEKKAWPGAPVRIGDCWARTWIGAAPEAAEVLIVGEGFSTVASIAEIYPNAAACVAFTAGALAGVAADIRRAFPDKPIVVLQDDDDLHKGGAGQKAARAASDAAKAAIAKPVREGAIADQPAVDFCDMWTADLHDRIREIIDAAIIEARGLVEAFSASPEADARPPEDEPTSEELAAYLEEQNAREDPNHWSKRLTYSRTGEMHATVHNAVIFLENHPDMAGLFIFDDFRKRICLSRRPPWAQGAWPPKGNPPGLADVADLDAIGAAIWLQSKGCRIKTADTWDALLSVAQRRIVNPVQDHIKALQWDGVSRLDTWLRDLYGAHDHAIDGVRINRVYGRKWLISMVARIFQPGCQVDHMLVLEGGEGIRKSTGLRELATIGGRSYFDDERLNLKDKDSSLSLEGLIIREVAELSGIKGAATEQVKAFVTRRHDRVRPPYGRTVREHPRTCVLAGTTNEFHGWIDGATGARRFWPVRCTKPPTIEQIRAIKDQLIAEAAKAYFAGEAWWFEDAATIAAAGDTVAARQTEHPWTQDILTFLSGVDEVQTGDIFQALNISIEKRTARDAAEIAKIMRSAGWSLKQVRRSINGAKPRPVRVWVLDEDIEPPPIEPQDAASAEPPAEVLHEVTAANDQAVPAEEPIAAQAERPSAPKAPDPAIVRFRKPVRAFRVNAAGLAEPDDWSGDDDDRPNHPQPVAAQAPRPI